jgi:hypothetical protein
MELFEGNLFELLPPACSVTSRPSRAGATRRADRTVQREKGLATEKALTVEKAFAKAVELPRRLRRQGCHCGACHSCLENARWEKIFNEKFADPTYYKKRGPAFSSPLSEAGG